MHAVLCPSPSRFHRYRVILPNKQVDFGSKTVQAYVDHRDPVRMRLELHMRGAVIPDSVRNETDALKIQHGMLMVDHSLKYDWSDVQSSDYWDRWLLQSYPTVEMAKLYMTMRQGILFLPLEYTTFTIEDHF